MRIVHFLSDESGPTSTEYAVLFAAILVVCVVSILGFGQSAMAMLENADRNVSTVTGVLDVHHEQSASHDGPTSWGLRW